MKSRKTHYESFKRQLAKKLESVKQLIQNASPYEDIDPGEVEDTKNSCLDEIDALEEVIVEWMGDILAD